MKKPSHKKILSNYKSNWYSRFLYWFRSLSIVKHIFVLYLFITVIGSIILYLPLSRNTDVSYIDALFTSASAFSDTGLVTMTTTETWTYFGQAIIASLIFVGGIGWFALKVYLFNILFGRPISFATREALASERGSSKIGVTRSLIKVSVTIMIVIILIAATILSIYFYFVDIDTHSGPMAEMSKRQNGGVDNFIAVKNIPTGDWGTSIRWGLFHAISALNNAGFDIMGAGSISPYYTHYGVQIIFIILFVTGGVGYPVIYDCYLWVRSKFTGEKHRWTLFTKISMVTYVTIVLISIGVTFAIELNVQDGVGYTSPLSKIPENNQTFWHNDAYGTKGQKSIALIFNTMSTRNAGFATIDMDMLSAPTMIFYSILMFIGSAPSSTAGGIRTTTIAIALMAIWTRIRGREKTRVFNRRLPTETTTRAYVVFTVAIIIVFFATIVCSTSFASFGGELNAYIGKDPSGNQLFNYSTNQNPFTYTEIFFEVSSAFGTTGLSTGVTPHLSLVAKLTLIIVMFIGQLGVSSSVLVWSPKNPEKKHYSFVKEDISIG